MSAPIRIAQIGRESLSKVARLHEKLLPRRGSRELLEWEFFDSALPAEGILIGAFAGSELIGTQTFIPMTAWSEGRSLLSCKSELTLLDPAHRGKGLFNQLYDAGFQACERAGVEAIWGFTSAVKPFSGVGFFISERPLVVEDIVLRPVRALRSSRGVFVAPPRPAVGSAALESVPDSPIGTFGLRRDEAYLEHRYKNNPRRELAWFDSEHGVVYSLGGEKQVTFISEVEDPAGLGRSARRAARIGRDCGWIALRRVGTTSRLRWATVPGALYRRTDSHLHIVFKWLAPRSSFTMPRIEVEEGYMEGTE